MFWNPNAENLIRIFHFKFPENNYVFGCNMEKEDGKGDTIFQNCAKFQTIQA